MADPASMRRVNEDDPERCQGDSRGGQCQFARLEGGKYCRIHAGAQNTLKNADIAAKRSYQLTRWKARVDDFSTSPAVKSLREEIGISRMMLEQILEKCQDATDLMLNSNKITPLVLTIEKLVSSCDRLETKLLLTLDKSAAILLAEQIINLITEEVEDPEIVERIAAKMEQVMINAGRVTQLEAK